MLLFSIQSYMGFYLFQVTVLLLLSFYYCIYSKLRAANHKIFSVNSPKHIAVKNLTNNGNINP